MAKRRGYIPLKEQLAAALRQLGDIPWEDARKMDADQVISLYHCDHGIFKTWEESPGEFDKHWNLTFRFIGAHREKTKGDVKIIRKADRVSEAHADHTARMAAKAGVPPMAMAAFEKALEICADFKRTARREARPKPKAKIQSRGFAKGKRKMQSRNSFAKRGDARR